MAAETRMAALPADTDAGVLGAGTMGSGIAQVACMAGHRVRLFDTRAGVARAAVESVCGAVRALVPKGRFTQEQAADACGRITAVESIGDLAGCGLVIEAIVEDLELKRNLFRGLEAVVSENALLATNTSSISVTAIGSALKTPERLLGMHFFNPAPKMPLVEIISGAATSAVAAATLYETTKKWGKTPVYAQSTPGFIVNRVARPFYAESLRVLSEGGADCATIDAILRESAGFRMGPFELMDLIGNDVNYAVTCSVFEAFYGDRRFTPSLLQRAMVDAGFLGRKTGRGFYQYGNGTPALTVSTSEANSVPRNIKLCGDSEPGIELAKRLTKAGVDFACIEPQQDGRIAQCEGVALFECDGRSATARAAALGVADVALVDLAQDFASAKRLAVALADQSDPRAAIAATGLLQAAGYRVSVIDDVPGMVVLRTVAMLINEAADAVNQNVCSASDCDLAMRKGVNYPLGPLEWADYLGIPRVVNALENLRLAYGEERYRVSPLLRRRMQAGLSFFGVETTAMNSGDASGGDA